MKSPKQQALELVALFITETIGYPTLSNKQAKQCALIHVDEIKSLDKGNEMHWQEVKFEIRQIEQ